MQGISSVVAPETGLVLPGSTFTVLDSHSCTVGALGAAAWASCAGDVLHTLATQTSILKKPPLMRIALTGQPGNGVTAKDMMLNVIRQLGIAGGAGCAIEFAGPVIRDNADGGPLHRLQHGGGARRAVCADRARSDDVRISQRPPLRASPAHWDAAVRDWMALVSDADARFDREVSIDVGGIAPQISWGSSPQDVIGIGERIPDPAAEADPQRRAQIEAALAYTGLQAGTAIAGTPVDFVFIGSCANNRISDLRSRQSVARGHKVADTVIAWVVPGSQQVK